MCGRLNIMADPLNQQVSDELRIRFSAEDNPDLRPTQTVSAVLCGPNGLAQRDMRWGMQPSWSPKLLINAQAETTLHKPTWRRAMQTHRCIVPCTGWYEWRDDGGPRKQRYHFHAQQARPLYMAGLWFTDTPPRLVTLTTQADTRCTPYHSRMPVLIGPDDIALWLTGSATALASLLAQPGAPVLSISPVDESCLGR